MTKLKLIEMITENERGCKEKLESYRKNGFIVKELGINNAIYWITGIKVKEFCIYEKVK